MIEGFRRHGRPELEATCYFIGTTAAIITAIGMGAAAGGSAYAAKKGADAAHDAAGMQTDAANHAADTQLAAGREAEAFARQQAQYTADEAEVNRRANYDQFRAKQQKLGSIGQMLGLGGVTIPDYVPGIQANFGAPGGGQGPGVGAPGGAPAPGQPGQGQPPAAGPGAYAPAAYGRVPSFAAALSRPGAGGFGFASSMPGEQPGAPGGMMPPWMTPRDPRPPTPYAPFSSYVGA